MYEVTVNIEARGTVFENVVYKRTMEFAFHDSIEANRLKDYCRSKGFECHVTRIQTLDSVKDAVEEIEDAIREMRR